MLDSKIAAFKIAELASILGGSDKASKEVVDLVKQAMVGKSATELDAAIGIAQQMVQGSNLQHKARRATGPAVYKVKATAPVFNNDALAASAVAKYRTDMASLRKSNRPGSRPAPAQPVRPVVKSSRPAPAPMHEYDRIASEAWAGGPYGAGFDSPFGKGKGR